MLSPILTGKKYVHTQVKLFNDYLVSIFMNFVPSKLITVNDWKTKLRNYWKTKANYINNAKKKKKKKNDTKKRDYEKLISMITITITEISNSK